MAGDWRDDADLGFEMLHTAADEWRTVEIADEARAMLKK